MQKKFLRTFVLTLVMGLSLVTACHAMDPDAESYETRQIRIAAKIKNMKDEAHACRRAYTHQPRDESGNLPAFSWLGSYSGVTHSRRASSRFKVHTNHNILGTWGNCPGCATLVLTAEAMKRDGRIYEAHDFQ